MTTSIPTQSIPASSISFRQPEVADAARAHRLVGDCQPLDLNSTYAYLLLCTHFAGTSAVADAGGRTFGFVGAYLKPADPSVLFIWQIAVSREARGRGVGRRLLHEVLRRPACRAVRYLEATVTPSNEPSRLLFRALARVKDAPCQEQILFRADDFGASGHEEEHLLRIGPFTDLGEAE